MKFKIGKSITGESEFGEIYHMACAYKLDENVTIEFEEFPAGETFFKTCFTENKRDQTNEEISHASKSANIIQQRFFSNCMNDCVKKINQLAEDEDWKLPHKFQQLCDDPADKVLLWHRSKKYQSQRNSSFLLIKQMRDLCKRNDTLPVLIGPKLEKHECEDLTDFWKEDFFQEPNSIAKQLWSLSFLFKKGGAIASLGVMSGAMDGLSMLFGYKTVFLARHQDATPRMQKVSSSIPNLIWHPVEFREKLTILSEAHLNSLESKIWC